MQRLTSISIALLFVFALLNSSVLAQINSNSNNSDVNTSTETQSNNRELHLYAAKLEPISEGPQEDETSEGKSIIGDPSKIRIINLGPTINHEGFDYAPTVSADGRTLYYVSNSPGSKLEAKGGKNDYSHDFWAAKKENRLDTVFRQPYNIDTTTHLGELGVNTKYNEGAASIAADKQSLYFTACNKPDGLGDCDIYKSTIQGDQWGRPRNLGRNVNSKHFDSQPSIAPDQSRIYFVSTREGPNSDGDPSAENMDIWYSDWDPELEEWQPAKNLEEINTPGEDVSPFIAADGVTLFFASTGYEPNYGETDFYVTRYNYETESWSEPENLGEPINTDGREQFITLPASGDILYFSSTRKDLSGYQGSLDVFMAFVPTFFRTILVKGSVFDECSDEFIPANITIRNPITGQVYTDSLTKSHQEFEIVIANKDFGDPRDSIQSLTLEITAENPNYGKTMKAQRVERPSKTTDADKADEPFEEIYVKLTMGQRPILATEIDEARYISKAKQYQPELASFRGLVMEEYLTWDLYPLLNYVFFDQGSAEIPDRYILFNSPEQTSYFTDTTIAGGTLDKYYHLLNIVGFRMKEYPDSKIEIVGCTDGTTEPEKKQGLSKERADNVFSYLKNVWQIDESRMKLTYRNKPDVVSNLKDSLGIRENRRVEIHSKNWQIMKPVFETDPKTFPQPEKMNFVMKNGIEDDLVTDRRIEIKKDAQMWRVLNDVGLTDAKKTWDWTSKNGQYPKNEDPYISQLVITTTSGAECKSDPIETPVMQVTTKEKKVSTLKDSTRETYSLILFPFDRADVGWRNDRIMNRYVYERILPESEVEVIGHTDIVGLYEHNQKLSVRRAKAVERGIMKKTNGKFSELDMKGVGEDESLYDNSLPEGRFYNRTVQVKINTPVEAWEEVENNKRAEKQEEQP